MQYSIFAAFCASVQKKEASFPATSTLTCTKLMPVDIADACASLIEASCSGVISSTFSSSTSSSPGTTATTLSSCLSIRMGSDLAMTALFALGLDMDLWGNSVKAATLVVGRVAAMFEHEGDLLRQQIPVQSFADALRVRFDLLLPSVEPLANHFATLLHAMPVEFASESKEYIHGRVRCVASCLAALSDCALGTMGAHVVLTVLVWLHQDADLSTRLARNLIMGQYHEVVAP